MCCGAKQGLVHNGIEISPNSCFFLLFSLIFLAWRPFIRIFFFHIFSRWYFASNKSKCWYWDPCFLILSSHWPFSLSLLYILSGRKRMVISQGIWWANIIFFLKWKILNDCLVKEDSQCFSVCLSLTMSQHCRDCTRRCSTSSHCQPLQMLQQRGS